MNTPTNQKVNQVGKYLYKHIDGAYKIKMSSNTCDVYVKNTFWDPEAQNSSDRYGEIKFNISITTYQNKIRVNVLSLTPDERTLGYDLYSPEAVQNLPDISEIIYQKIAKRLRKLYPDYNFLTLWIYGV